MSFLSRLFGRDPEPRQALRWSWPRIGILPIDVQTGNYSVDVVDETRFQREIKAVRNQLGPDHVPVYLNREPQNPGDPNSIAVMSGLFQCIGYLQPALAMEYAKTLDEVAAAGFRATCMGEIVEGGGRGKPFRVRIDLPAVAEVRERFVLRRSQA